MKTPSRTSIVIVLAVIATVSVVIFQGCANEELLNGKKINVKIGKDKDSFVEFRDKNEFDCALEALGPGNYQIRYKAHDGDTPVDNYQPTCHHKTSLKTDSITTSELAKNEPPGDPNITQRIQSNDITAIEKVLNTLTPPP
jgi:hypothetical protein